MLPSKHRITTKKEFDLVYKKGKKYHTPYFIVLTIPNNNEVARFGFVASKKVGKAVKRNLAKRRLRALIFEELPRLKSDFDAVVVIFNTAPDAPFEDLKIKVQEALNKQGLYK